MILKMAHFLFYDLIQKCFCINVLVTYELLRGVGLREEKPRKK